MGYMGCLSSQQGGGHGDGDDEQIADAENVERLLGGVEDGSQEYDQLRQGGGHDEVDRAQGVETRLDNQVFFLPGF
jgi:hypothetical protein